MKEQLQGVSLLQEPVSHLRVLYIPLTKVTEPLAFNRTKEQMSSKCIQAVKLC